METENQAAEMEQPVEQTQEIQPVEQPVIEAEPKAETEPQPQIDISKILSDKELRKQLLSHPDVNTEIERRVVGTAGQRQRELWERWEAQKQAEADRQAQMSMPDDELGRNIKQQQIYSQLEQSALSKAYMRAGNELFTAALADPDFDDNDKAVINPEKHKTFTDFFNAVANTKAEKIAKKMLPKMVEVEAEARVKDIMAKQRGDGTAPAIMDSGKGGSFNAPAAIYKAYSEGRFGTVDDPYSNEADKRLKIELAKFGVTL
jgi:hypothetical protein